MNYRIISVTSFFQNCLLIWCEKTGLAALIDPGGDTEKIKKEIKKNNVDLIKILITHGHLDHVGAVDELTKYYKVPVFGPEKKDKFWLEILSEQSYMFGIKKSKKLIPNFWLSEGEIVTIGKIILEVLFCPGHTPGHVVFFSNQFRLLISGDVLFKGNIGRSDFPKGNKKQLIQSIRKKILPLGDDVIFIPGHGPISTIGYERKNNPFL